MSDALYYFFFILYFYTLIYMMGRLISYGKNHRNIIHDDDDVYIFQLMAEPIKVLITRNFLRIIIRRNFPRRC